MTFLKTAKKSVVWTVLVCMFTLSLSPMFLYAESEAHLLVVDDASYELETEPYENSMGLILNAEEVCRAFEFDFVFDETYKSFEITSGDAKVMLMHEATHYYKGEESFECQPHFFVENGPMIELSLFCEIFGKEFSYDKDQKTIVVTSKETSEEIWTDSSSDEESADIQEEPVTEENGEIAEVTASEDEITEETVVKEENAEDTPVLTDEPIETPLPETKSDEEEKESTEETEKTTESDILEKENPLTEESDKTEVLPESESAEEEVMMFSTRAVSRTLSGRLSLEKQAPSSGLEVEFILQPMSTMTSTLYSSSIYLLEDAYSIGKVSFNSGEIYKNYNFAISEFYTNSNYSQYCIYLKVIKNGKERTIHYIGDYNDYLYETSGISISYVSASTSRRKFSFLTDQFAYPTISEEDLAESSISGTMTLPAVAPEGGLTISLILENTKQYYNWLYGVDTDTYIGDGGHKIADIEFAKGEKTKDYYIDVWEYQNTSYEGYVIFYETTPNELIDTKGYVKNDGTTKYSFVAELEGELKENFDKKLFQYNKETTFDITFSEKDLSCGENAFWSYDNQTKTLTISGTGDMYGDTQGNFGWAYYRDEIINVVIQDGITSIAEKAFYNCIALESVDIPKSVKKIGASAFRNCSNLQTVVIPDGVKELYYGTFRGCENLTLIVIPKSMRSIEDAFSYYGKLNLAYAGSESDWNENGFDNECFNKKYFNYKEFKNVDGIDYLIRNDRTAVVLGGIDDTVTSLAIPEKVDGVNVTEIAANAFADTNLTNVTLPVNLKAIGEYAFYECYDLITVNMRDNVTFIGKNAFAYCSSLTNITLSRQLSKIEESLFYNCYNLAKIAIPENVTEIAYRAFYYCSGLTEVIIPDSVTTINTDAFEYCRNLKTVFIGKGLSEVGSEAFYRTGINNVYIEDIGAWCKIQFEDAYANPLYYNSATLYINNEKAEIISIPDDVTSINDYAFYNCRSLKNVVLPDGLTSIGKYAFDGCYNLTSINLPDTILTIGQYAFSECSLINVDIPKQLQIINEYTFAYCDFKTLTIPASVEVIKGGAFSDCYSLAEVFVPSRDTQIVGSAFSASKLKIYGLLGSNAETYASTKGYTFEAMDEVIYTITFDSNGGTSVPAAQKKGFGNSITLTREYPVKKHSTFLGWSTSVDGKVEYLSGDTFIEDKDITLYAVWTEPAITVETKAGIIGKEIKVSILLSNNPGIAGMQFKLNYPEGFTLTKIECGDALTDLVFTTPGNFGKNPIVLSWDGLDADNSNGKMLTLSFMPDENIEEGYYPIEVETLEYGIYDDNLLDVNFKVINGGIEIKDYMPGDINGDGVVSTKDVTILRRYIAGGYDVDVIENALDINSDGEVTTKDVTILRRFIAGGYGVEL